MESKLCHRQGVLSLPNQTATFPSHSFSSKRHLRGFAKKWRIHLQEEANGQNSYKHLLVHVVKEGETLTSISKQYGVSVYSIAAVNKNIVDVDLVFEGQRLNIPSSVREELQATVKNVISSFDLKEIHRRSLNVFYGRLDKRHISMQITHRLPHIWRNRLPSFDLKETLQHSLNVFDGPLDKKYFIMEITHGLPQVSRTLKYFSIVFGQNHWLFSSCGSSYSILHQMHDWCISH
ncbi:hypothetical protein KPL71_008496 [Citrus sinensis]|uniref:Uncharacterized protein n=2 Tax=Citrus sinensis TaxID=2711 RepID=A0ACB8M8E0_CITSI|nr:hypothetical protein KPL71_008483 [Citrus sinensis]KAH9781489.1 hypothetical protein KPL71_008496 [Citrus sinensis]